MTLLLLRLALTATLLCGAALVLERVLANRGRSAGLRHRWITFALLATLLVPALAAFAPSTAPRVQVLPAREATGADLLRVRPARVAALPVKSEPSPAPLDPVAAIAWLWLAVAAARLGRTTLGCARVLRMRRGEAAPEPLASLADGIARRMGVGRPQVRLAEVGTPMTAFGVVVLPHAAATWSRRRQEVALAHELAHLRRADGTVNLLVRLATDLVWFHPFVHLAARRADLLREMATDDLAAAALSDELAYAEDLIALAAVLRDPPPAVAVGALGADDLQRRLEALLDARRGRGSSPRAPRRTLLLGALLLAAPLAALDGGGVEDPTTTGALMRILEDSNADVRLAALCGLEARADRTSFYALLPHLHEVDPVLRARVVRALAAIECDPSYVAVVGALDDPSPAVRVAAAHSLAGYNRWITRQAPTAFLDDWPASTRSALDESVGAWCRASARQRLAALAESDPDDEVRRVAAASLARLD